MILVNFKNYKQSFGQGALNLAKICKRVSEKTKVEIVPVVSALDAVQIIKELSMKVYIQHVDDCTERTTTGFISPIQAQEAGVSGSLINHSEHQIKPGTVKSILKNSPKNFESIVCIKSFGQAEKWAKNIKPSMIAYEPSYLIGNKEKSVATEKPEVIEKIVKKYAPIPILVGAGIRSEEDVKVSLKLGAKGILISSAVMTSSDPEKELIKLATAFSV